MNSAPEAIRRVIERQTGELTNAAPDGILNRTGGENMANASDAKIRANAAYNKRNYESILLIVPKGAKEKIKAAASAQGLSVNRYLLEMIERETGLKLTLDGEFKTGKKQN